MKTTNVLKWALPFVAIVVTLWACYSFSTPNNNTSEKPVQEEADTFTQSFDRIIGGSKLTVVDFYTTWCGPCKMMDPHVKRAARELKEDANVMQVDAEAYANISSRYNLEGYPTLIFFKKGVVVHRIIGYQGFEQIKAAILKMK